MELFTVERPSVRRIGQVISAGVEERAVHVRRAVEQLRGGLMDGAGQAYLSLFAPRWKINDLADESIAQCASWALVCTLLLARLEQKIEDFGCAEEWFSPTGLPRLCSFVHEDARRKAEKSIGKITFDDDFEHLLPYVLESHGPGSRLSVMRDPSTRTARQTKKRDGVFYTPADVAEYITRTVAESVSKDANFLDPSCGTGVFLLALLRRGNGAFDYFLEHLNGIDACAHAIDSCAFSVLHACRGSYQIAPLCAWQLIRMNLVVHDSLRLRDWPCETLEQLKEERSRLRNALLNGQLPDPFPVAPSESLQAWKAPGHRSIWELFPAAYRGFDAVVGNPPYAPMGRRDDARALEEYATLPEYSPTANTYPLFVEMMWRFVKRSESCSGLVVPLSIAFHQGRQFIGCRRAMEKAGGHWRCAFFDREPNALFGEDVKVRNAIVFRSDGDGEGPRLSVTPLLKWTSKTRARLFSSISFTSLGRIVFEKGMPKLGGDEEASVFASLAKRESRLGNLCIGSQTCLPADALREPEEPRVYVASTAYNFLNVFRPFNGVAKSPPLSENKIHALGFGSEADAKLVFAILSSRLTFWLWHTQGDGFHVGRRFLEGIPFQRNSFDAECQNRLEELGGGLWAALQAHRIVSVNRGRQTVAFRPLSCARERDEIDSILVRSANLPAGFVDTLRSFVEQVVVVDGKDDRRSHLREYFNRGEINS